MAQLGLVQMKLQGQEVIRVLQWRQLAVHQGVHLGD
jgi:hypothetical protein